MEDYRDGSVICPKCKSEYVIQIHRLSIEKWISMKRKYQCTDCSKQFFISKPKKNPVNQNVIPKSESFFHFFRS